jgi:hypothetical protein
VLNGLKISTVLLAALTACAAFRASAAANAENAAINVTDRAEEKLSFSIEPPVDGPTLAYQIMRSFLSAEQWAEQVDAVRQKFARWEKENDGDIGRYLNDRFIMVAMSAAGGEVEKMKRSIIFLAFYKEFNQQPPAIVVTALKKHKGSLSQLFTDFTWEKAAQYIQNKGWRQDIKDRKSKLAAVGN